MSKSERDGLAIAVAIMLLMLAGALITAGVYIKSGPEVAMIVVGGILAWFATLVVKVVARD